MTPFPLQRGQHGEPIRDLQRRLGAAGHNPVGVEAGSFCSSTETALQQFQEARGLHASGVCDEQSWLALVEAGWKLGDRLLVLSAPQLRGDDIENLQRALNHVGFDCGRPDGILGPATIRALTDFQRNCGLNADGICGRKTVHMLDVLRRQSGSGPGVAAVREFVNDPPTTEIYTLRIVVGQFGGLSSIGRSVARALRQQGAAVMSTDEYDAAAQAAAVSKPARIFVLRCPILPYLRSSQSVGDRSAHTSYANSTASCQLRPRCAGCGCLFYAKRGCRRFCVRSVQSAMSSTPRVR